MKYNRLSFLSVFVALGVSPMVADAAIRIGDAVRNKAQAYQQVNLQRYGSLEQQPTELPITVVDQQLAEQIQSGDSDVGVTIDELNSCSMIYPNGEFEWAQPSIGVESGGATKCTSVVELRVLIPSGDKEYTTLARANLAAGDSFDCNVSNFPDWTLLDAAGAVEFPADAEPTVEDVVAVMNEEQKQNAAIKIIGAAVLGGLSGNVAGKNEVGKDGMLGLGKDKLITSAIGAVGGASLMAASTYSGKVAGDMILSTGVNAAAGAVIGNMITDGDAVVRIEKCVINNQDRRCVWGYLEDKDESSTSNKNIYVSVQNPSSFMVCGSDDNNCEYEQNIGGAPSIEGFKEREAVSQNNKKNTHSRTVAEIIRSKDWNEGEHGTVELYCLNNNKMSKDSDGVADCDAESKKTSQYLKVKGAYVVKKRIPVMVPIDETDTSKRIVFTKKDWQDRNAEDEKKKLKLDFGNVYGRNNNGQMIDLDTEAKNIEYEKNFVPMYQEAEDGGIIELENKARLKGTLTGAGVGAAAGAFTAYQGAQAEIDQRYTAAIREYKDSLQKFYCATGKRFLSFYNDSLVIPLQNQE